MPNSTQFRTEFVLWAVRKGDEDWQEELITTAPVLGDGMAKIEAARAWAVGRGFDRFRVTRDEYPFTE